MPAGMVAAERTPVRLDPAPAGPGPLHHVLKELETAKRVINDLAYAAYDQLDGAGMHSLAIAEGCIAGAIHKIEAAGVQR